jgi:ribosomal protein S18 acetylase RimI-like enzyme
MRELLSGANGNSMVTSPSSWDSTAFQRNVHLLHQLAIADDSTFEAEAHSAMRNLASEGISLLTTRISSARTHDLELLQRIGFRVVETTYSPMFSGELSDARLSEFVVRTSTGDELEDIMGVAREAFTVSRFHNDPHIPDEMANLRYVNWVKNAASSDSQELLSIVNTSNELVAFFISETINGEAYWHLTAIAEAFRGRGLAIEVWQSVMRAQSELGVTRFRTTISGANMPVVNLYPRLGFRLENPQTSLHLHL